MAKHTNTVQPDFHAQAAKIIAAQQARFDAFVPVGVTWSAMSREYPKVERVEDVAARLEAEDASHRAYRASPGGRFLTALEALESGGYYSEAYRLRCQRASFYYRGGGLPIEGEPLNACAVGACLVILARIPGRDAADAREALGEMLMGEPTAVRAA